MHISAPPKSFKEFFYFFGQNQMDRYGLEDALKKLGGATVIKVDTLHPIDWSALRSNFHEFTDGVAIPAGAFGKTRSASESYNRAGHRIVRALIPALAAEFGVEEAEIRWFPDGYCLRYRPITAEIPHRDHALPGTVMVWFADTVSVFEYVPNSWQESDTGQGLVKAESPPESAWKKLKIPAGDVFVFLPCLLHRVAGFNYSKSIQQRYFAGFSTEPPSPEMVHCIKTGQYPGPPSGHPQTVYPKLWMSNNPQKAIEMAAKMKPHAVTIKTVPDKPLAESTKRKIAKACKVDPKSVKPGFKYPVPHSKPQPIPRDVFATMGDQVETALELIGANRVDQ